MECVKILRRVGCHKLFNGNKLIVLTLFDVASCELYYTGNDSGGCSRSVGFANVVVGSRSERLRIQIQNLLEIFT